MDELIGGTYRFVMYVFSGFTLEIIYSVLGIELSLGTKLKRHLPKKYLEGFVSLWMIPIHGFGMLFGFEALAPYVGELNIFLRFVIWAITITGMEALTGFIYDKIKGFYCWDYYEKSRFKVFKRGYTLWTLLPQWGIAGLILEVYSRLLIKLTPHAVEFFKSLI